MTYKIDEIEGIGSTYAVKLKDAGVHTTEEYLQTCCDTKGRKAFAEKTGLTEQQLLKWANMADLMRVSGIGSEYSELLEAAGVDTIKELRTRNVANLASKMEEINNQKNLCRTTPSTKTVEKWVEQAENMKPMITY